MGLSPELPEGLVEAVARRLVGRHTAKWLDRPVPDLALQDAHRALAAALAYRDADGQPWLIRRDELEQAGALDGDEFWDAARVERLHNPSGWVPVFRIRDNEEGEA